MNTQINTPLNLDDLICTDKARQHIQNFTTDLTGRERQLIVLMTRDTVLCNRACERLLTKIDLNSLIKRGYLNIKSTSANDENHINMSSPVAQQEEIDPALNLIAGNY